MSEALPVTDASAPSAGLWLLAVAPVALLLALVLWGRLSTTMCALATVAAAAVIATASFGADAWVIAVGLGKGAWVGVWILGVIWPALLVHHLSNAVGMSSLGRFLGSLSRSRIDTVLFLAWVLPSFIQGVSGFGTPIALCAPLLVAVGVGKIRAVTLPLIGYHWAVGFGSVGSSFYMGTLTARLDPTQTDAFASSAAVVLGANAILAGVLVAVMEGGWRGLRVSWPLLATVGPAMAVAQWLVVSHVPAIGALCAGATGIVIFLGVQLLRSKVNAALPREAPTDESPGAAPTSAKRASADSASAEPARSGDVAPVAARDTALDEPVGERPSTPSGGTRRHGVRALTAAAPHLALAALALAVLVPPASRQYVTNHLLIGPSFPSTTSGRGVVNDAVHTYNPIALLGHPGTFLLAGCLVGLIVWRIAGVWPRGAWAAVRKPWITQALKASPSVVLLAAIAGVLVDSGMIRAIALGAAAVAGPVYPVFAPLLGALGSFITGSTTSSNALFSALQRDVAMLIDVPPSDLLAAQLAGGNIGNSLAPMVALLGLSAIGRPGAEGDVVRRTLPSAAVLLASAVGLTFLLLALHS